MATELRDEKRQTPPHMAAATKDVQAQEADDGDSQRSASPARAKATLQKREQAAPTSYEAPLPYDEPPLPDEAPPDDDGWEPVMDYNANAWYFYNRLTGKSQWENPRVPAATTTVHGSYDRSVNSSTADPTTTSGAPGTSSPPKRKYGGYNPAIHGNYDPNADYAREAEKKEEEEAAAAAAAAAVAAGLPDPRNPDYSTAVHFNRFTGRFQQAGINPENHNDANKSKRQMTAFFDVDAAANIHDGRSLKAERRAKHISKKELKAYKEKRHNKKEEKRRAWLKD